MARGTNQKFKLLRLAEIMLQKTDEENYITMPEILAELEKYEITAERKSIYQDLQDLSEFGIEVEGEQYGRAFYYHVVSRQFELPELKLLVDAIQSSKFITAKKTNQLIKKLETLCSEEQAKELQRQVIVQGRIKTMNETIYYSVDEIHNAINENRKIAFQYFNWNEKKEMELRHDGNYYCVSPWALTWDDENYYMVGYDSEDEKIKHYRVDKMLKIYTVDEYRDGKEHFKEFNAADYAKKNFSMFGGTEEEVTLEVSNDMCGIFIDRFGKDISIVPAGKGKSRIHLKVALSSHFISWIFALGEGVKITGNKAVLEAVDAEISRLVKQYK